jgi:hypothetical protein
MSIMACFPVTHHEFMAHISPIRAQLTVAPPWRAGACRSVSSVRGRQEWSGRNHAVPTSDVTSLDVPGDALARLYLMVVRGRRVRRLRVQDSAGTGLAVSALLCGRAC